MIPGYLVYRDSSFRDEGLPPFEIAERTSIHDEDGGSLPSRPKIAIEIMHCDVCQSVGRDDSFRLFFIFIFN